MDKLNYPLSFGVGYSIGHECISTRCKIKYKNVY